MLRTAVDSWKNTDTCSICCDCGFPFLWTFLNDWILIELILNRTVCEELFLTCILNEPSHCCDYTESYTDSVWAENKHYSVWKHQWSSNTSVRLTIEFTLMCGCSASCSLTALLSFSVHSPHHRLFLWSCCVWMDSGDVVLLPLWPFCSRVQTHRLPQLHRTEANVYEWPQPRINRNERLCYKYN